MNREYEYGAIHKFLAEVAVPQLIVVTNYDTLLEQAFRAADKPYDLVVYPTDSKELANGILWWPHGSARPRELAASDLDIDLEETSVIYKMHGSIVRDKAELDSYVITEEDYVEFLSRMTINSAIPSLFLSHFRERSFLFLGYSLRDWNLRVVLRNLNKYLAKRGGDELPSWAIQYNVSALERKLWANRKVTIFELTLDEFVTELRKQKAR